VLGLTTLVDLVVVLLFTHPIMVLLARTKFFGGGHKMSGLDPASLGRDSLYKGGGKVRTPVTVGAGTAEQPVENLTLAERKAKARAASATKDGE
jgi:preprotein translocase subunit SecD